MSRGEARYDMTLKPITSRASSSSWIFMLEISAAMAEPERPATTMAASRSAASGIPALLAACAARVKPSGSDRRSRISLRTRSGVNSDWGMTVAAPISASDAALAAWS